MGIIEDEIKGEKNYLLFIAEKYPVEKISYKIVYGETVSINEGRVTFKGPDVIYGDFAEHWVIEFSQQNILALLKHAPDDNEVAKYIGELRDDNLKGLRRSYFYPKINEDETIEGTFVGEEEGVIMLLNPLYIRFFDNGFDLPHIYFKEGYLVKEGLESRGELLPMSDLEMSISEMRNEIETANKEKRGGKVIPITSSRLLKEGQ